MMNARTCIFLNIIFFSMICNAEIPPLCQELREAYASHIISGKVLNMQKKLVERNNNMKDYVFDVSLEVSAIEKGTENAAQINFSFWKAAQRPGDWCGPGGQHSIFDLENNIRAYLQKDELGTYKLIIPNGFDIL